MISKNKLKTAHNSRHRSNFEQVAALNTICLQEACEEEWFLFEYLSISMKKRKDWVNLY